MKHIKKYERITNSEFLDKIYDFFSEIILPEHRVIITDGYLLITFLTEGYIFKLKKSRVMYSNQSLMDHFYPYLQDYLEMKIPTYYRNNFNLSNIDNIELSKDEYDAFAESQKYNL